MSVPEQLQVLGVHPIDEAPDPCYLVELRVGPGLPALDLTAITQPTSGLPGNGWQAPVEAHLLDADGASGQLLEPGAARAVQPPARLAFFFHFLQLDRPLLTPIGPVQLPAPAPRPPRLAFLRYTT